MKVFVVRDAFGDYAKGQAITDPAEQAKITEAKQDGYCTVTDLPEDFFKPDETPAPKGKSAPSAAPAAPNA